MPKYLFTVTAFIFFQLLQASPIQQNVGNEQVVQQYVRDVEQQKVQNEEYGVSEGEISPLSAQSPQSPLNRSPSSLPSSVPEMKIRQQPDLPQERDDIFPQVLTGQRRLTEPLEEVPKRKVSVQSVESLTSSGAGIGGSAHQQIIYQILPVGREQSVSSVYGVPQRVQLIHQALPFVSYSRSGYSSLIPQREIYVPSYSPYGNVQNVQQPQQVYQLQQSAGVEQVGQQFLRDGLVMNVEQQKLQNEDYGVSEGEISPLSAQSSQSPQSPINRSPSLLPSSVPEVKVRQQPGVPQERDDRFPQEVPKRKVSVQSVESLISSGAGIGGVSHQQIIPQSVPVIREQSPAVDVQLTHAHVNQQLQQQALPFVSYSQLSGGVGQQREIQVPLVNQQQLVNQVVREVRQQVQPYFHNLRAQPLSPQLSGQRQYIQTMLQPSVHHLVFQPQSLQVSSLRQLANPYQVQYVLRQWPEWAQPLSGGSQLIVQPLRYSGSQDSSLRGLDGVSGYEISAKPDDNLKLMADQQSEPHPGLYGHQIGTKSVGSVNV